ncbi:MAG: DNA replication/repair protein RecF [Chlamydiales bacterium]
MYLERLCVRFFRHFKEREFSFSSRLNLIWGDNAKGKTSLLEAIHLFTAGRSFRTNRLTEILQHEAEAFSVEAFFNRNSISQRLFYQWDGKVRKILHNKTPCQLANGLLGLVPSVVIHPEDDMIKGTAQARRKFMDMYFSITDREYLQHLSRYVRALKQRNSLLRSHQTRGLEVWEETMAQAAGYLVKKRSEYIAGFVDKGKKLHHSLSKEEEEFGIVYTSKAAHMFSQEEIAAFYIQEYREHRQKEMGMGTSLIGPHRDDLYITVDGKEARKFGSEGQKRTCVAVLRLLAWHHVKSFISISPLILIDDLTAYYDASRREKLLSYCCGLGQVFVTMTSPPKNIRGDIEFHLK